MLSIPNIRPISTLASRIRAAFQPQQESLVMQAKRMLTTLSFEDAARMPIPVHAYAGHLTPPILREELVPHIALRLGNPTGAGFNLRQMLISDATFKIREAGRKLQAKMDSAKQDKRIIQDGTRKSWFIEWKKEWDLQINIIKRSKLSKDDIVSVVKELLDDLKHYSFLTEKERTELFRSEDQAITIFSTQS